MPDQLQTVRTVYWEEESTSPPQASLRLLDQSVLPQQVVYLRLTHEREVAEAIRSLKVRGAPVIGVTAAFGMALALRRLADEHRQQSTPFSVEQAQEHLLEVANLLRQTRPTAVNLFWAIDRLLSCARQAIAEQADLPALVQRLQAEAVSVAAEDVAACLSMGELGASLIAETMTVLTHCNAGALATSGLGTALAPIYVARQQGKNVHVFVDETRPVLQGARLTAWELQQAGVPLTLITDSMAGSFMRQGRIQAVFVGADRIAANGDVANKIGTYSVAVLAHAHSIPFYVVAPCSTVDLSLATGDAIPIEQRQSTEVTTMAGKQLAPEGIQVANPAFDVTPSSYISAIITEKGIIRPPFDVMLQKVVNLSTGKVLANHGD